MRTRTAILFERHSLQSLFLCRHGATALWVKNGTQWWVTGGGSSSGSWNWQRSTTVYDVASGKWEVGPYLDENIFGHCLVATDDGRSVKRRKKS